MHLTSVTFHTERYPTDAYYPFNLSLFRALRRLAFDTPVTFFAGENGTGKSTLLTALCRKCGIHIWENTERTRYENNPYEDKFSNYLSVEWRDGKVPGSFFGSDTFRHFAQILDEWAAADPGQLRYFGGRSLLTQSHGQSLMSFFQSRYKIRGLYLLDEPETALSPRTQLELLRILTKTGTEGLAQFVIATHSPILLACPDSVIYSFDGPAIRRISYEQTDHYRIYKSFLTDRSDYLKDL
ncbi:MAG: AAA family ATPase [Deltaproteobacteria bacterium]|nr:AAA family ATPase [Deltaproteobacteria bacterium]